jgi:hypothetical protein
MTLQEAQMLQDLVRKVEGTQLTEKDPDAEALLNDGLARDPDALYKLAQTVLIQNIALEQAHEQMQQTQLAPPPARATSFLGGLLHRNPPQYTSPNQPQYAAPPPQYQAVPPGYAGSYPPPPGYGVGVPSGGGFLRSAATTAAGVAGGMLAFQGIESLLHGGMGGGWGGYGGAPQEKVINNYYDDPAQQQAGNLGGPDEQPQGPYATSSDIGGPDEQPQGPYDDSGSDPGSDQGSGDDAQAYADDSGGGDFGGDAGGGDFGGGDFGAN